jgi:hypothetical protein
MDLAKRPQRNAGEPAAEHQGHLIDHPTQHAVVRKFKNAPTSINHSSLVEWGELEDGFCIFPCDAISRAVCVVPNMPMLTWAESRGVDTRGVEKKRTAAEMRREELVLPALGGCFTVLPMVSWTGWFTDEVVLNRVDEKEGEE